MSQFDAGMDDNELLRRFYGFDEAAFDELIRRWRPQFQRLFVRCGFPIDECEDLIQELAVRIYLTRERLGIDIRQPAAPYLRTMARNLAARELRNRWWRSDRWEAIGVEERFEAAPEGVPEALHRDLETAFSKLPEVEQNYLLLCKEHGLGELTHGEIASKLEVSSAYVSQVSKRALARLRKHLRGQGYRIQPDEKTDQE